MDMKEVLSGQAAAVTIELGGSRREAGPSKRRRFSENCDPSQRDTVLAMLATGLESIGHTGPLSVRMVESVAWPWYTLTDPWQNQWAVGAAMTGYP